jgi:Fe-S cluster biogenesis protein NfuA
MLQSIRRLNRANVLTFSRSFATISAELTPNPQSTIFTVDSEAGILGKGARSVSFDDRYACQSSPLASALFKISGVGSVMLGVKSVTVTKKPEFDWAVVRPSVELVLSQFIDSGIPVIRPEAVTREGLPAEGLPETEAKIRQLIQERVQPFVAQDGGDLEFVSFEEKSGVVKVRMHGACKGCPKSAVTLKLGIERMLKHYVPEVVGVIDVGSASSEGGKVVEEDKVFGP